MDDSFRDVLPHFQLGDDAPWVYPWLVELVAIVSVLALTALLLVLLVRRRRYRRLIWDEFRCAALERGLSAAQAALVARVGRHDKTRNPLRLLTSVKFFNRGLDAYFEGLDEGQTRQAEVDALVHIRILLGFDVVPADSPLDSTRQLSTGQRLMVWPVKGGPPGFCQTVVAHRDDDAILVVPLLRADDGFLSHLEVGDAIKARFWRRHDTEYRFRSCVLESDTEITGITIAHSDCLERIQKRDFYRLPVQLRMNLIIVPAERMAGAENLTAGRHIEVAVTDVSGGGLGVTSTATPGPDVDVLVDPEYSGPFPLAGLRCHVAGQQDRDGQHCLRLEFADISREQQEDLVSIIQQQHIRRTDQSQDPAGTRLIAAGSQTEMEAGT